MQYLQKYLRAVCMHSVGDRPVLIELIGALQRQRFLLDTAFQVRCDTARDDQRRATARALGEKIGQFRDGILAILKARVHRPHDDAITQCLTAHLDRRQESWKRILLDAACGHWRRLLQCHHAV